MFSQDEIKMLGRALRSTWETIAPDLFQSKEKMLNTNELQKLREDVMPLFYHPSDPNPNGLIVPDDYVPTDDLLQCFAYVLTHMDSWAEQLDEVPEFDEYDDNDYFRIGNQIWATSEFEGDWGDAEDACDEYNRVQQYCQGIISPLVAANIPIFKDPIKRGNLLGW